MDNTQNKKIGFWILVSIVLSSQIGSGVLLLPASLASLGGISILSWVFTGIGALALALVFGLLSEKMPHTGGPHVFVNMAFGEKTAFMIGWAYWIVSWVSTSAVVIASIGYLGSIVGGFDSTTSLCLEISILLIFTFINLLGLRTSGGVEIIFTVLKIMPLVLLPLFCFFYFNYENLLPLNNTGKSNFSVINAAAVLAFWGFIGVECATTSAGSVENPSKNVPRAIILGTVIVAIIYLFSTLGVMGVIPQDQLAESKAPFADAAKVVFGGSWYMVVSLAASVVCMGTLNAWILVSGQIALGAAEEKLFPKFFGITNRFGSPYISILIASLGNIPLLIMSHSSSLTSQFTSIIDVSVTAFLIIYLICVLSLFKLKQLYQEVSRVYFFMVISFALIFCLWALLAADIRMIAYSSLAFLSAVPAYLIRKLLKD